MKHRPLAILLIAIIALHAIAGSNGGIAVLCLGGGHHHTAAEPNHCESTCGHDSPWPLPIPEDEHDHDCGCIDIELIATELLTVPRGEDGISNALVEVSVPAWGIVLAESCLSRRGPPRSPPWFNPSRTQRLAIVASFRLII